MYGRNTGVAVGNWLNERAWQEHGAPAAAAGPVSHLRGRQVARTAEEEARRNCGHSPSHITDWGQTAATDDGVGRPARPSHRARVTSPLHGEGVPHLLSAPGPADAARCLAAARREALTPFGAESRVLMSDSAGRRGPQRREAHECSAPFATEGGDASDPRTYDLIDLHGRGAYASDNSARGRRSPQRRETLARSAPFARDDSVDDASAPRTYDLIYEGSHLESRGNLRRPATASPFATDEEPSRPRSAASGSRQPHHRHQQPQSPLFRDEPQSQIMHIRQQPQAPQHGEPPQSQMQYRQVAPPQQQPNQGQHQYQQQQSPHQHQQQSYNQQPSHQGQQQYQQQQQTPYQQQQAPHQRQQQQPHNQQSPQEYQQQYQEQQSLHQQHQQYNEQQSCHQQQQQSPYQQQQYQQQQPHQEPKQHDQQQQSPYQEHQQSPYQRQSTYQQQNNQQQHQSPYQEQQRYNQQQQSPYPDNEQQRGSQSGLAAAAASMGSLSLGPQGGMGAPAGQIPVGGLPSEDLARAMAQLGRWLDDREIDYARHFGRYIYMYVYR